MLIRAFFHLFRYLIQSLHQAHPVHSPPRCTVKSRQQTTITD